MGRIIPLAPLLEGMVDVHSHVLFGTDDGAKTIDKSTDILQAMSESGVKRVFCTPHIMNTVSDKEMENRKPHFEQLVQTVGKTVELRLAGEYMIEAELEQKLEQEVYTFDGTHMLIEQSYLFGSPRLAETIYDLQMKGFVPILAHPERYLYHSDRAIDSLTDRGCLLQLNLPSLLGFYGKAIQKRASQWLVQGKFHFVGSDTHSLNTWRMITRGEIDRNLKTPLSLLLLSNQKLWTEVPK